MKNKINKTKYAVRAATLALIFVFLASAASASEITPDNVIRYVNLARASQGLNDLVPNAKLMRAANDKLNDMIANGYFAHTSPTGVTPWQWFQKEDYDYHFAGENLAINFTTAESEQAAWMQSPTHRKNILDSRFEEIGVAVGTTRIDGQASIIAVQEFGATFEGIPSGAKKFSSFRDGSLMNGNGRNIPQVLSVENAAPEKNPSESVSQPFGEEKIFFIEEVANAAFAVFMLSMVLMAAAILVSAAERISAIVRQAKLRTESI